MQRLEMDPDYVTLASILRHYCTIKCLSKGQILHARVDDVNIISTHLLKIVSPKCIDDAQDALELPNTYLYNILKNAYTRNR